MDDDAELIGVLGECFAACNAHGMHYPYKVTIADKDNQVVRFEATACGAVLWSGAGKDTKLRLPWSVTVQGAHPDDDELHTTVERGPVTEHCAPGMGCQSQSAAAASLRACHLPWGCFRRPLPFFALAQFQLPLAPRALDDPALGVLDADRCSFGRFESLFQDRLAGDRNVDWPLVSSKLAHRVRHSLLCFDLGRPKSAFDVWAFATVVLGAFFLRDAPGCSVVGCIHS